MHPDRTGLQKKASLPRAPNQASLGKANVAERVSKRTCPLNSVPAGFTVVLASATSSSLSKKEERTSVPF